MTTQLNVVPMTGSETGFMIGLERYADGRSVLHAVPVSDKTNTAVCGARVRVRRRGGLGLRPRLGCRTCARHAASLRQAS
jgi:hypothetical protein